MLSENLARIDATTFQSQVIDLSETLAQKVLREGNQCIAGPAFTKIDIFVLVRHARTCFRFMSYVNADERRRDDPYYREEYTVMALGSVRTMIDCLYNIMAILQDPAKNGRLFRLSGLVKKLKDLQDEESRYGHKEEWTAYLKKARENLRFGLRQSGFDPDNMPQESSKWPTLGRFLGDNPAKDDSIKSFLRLFTYGHWRQYSQLMHASFEGLTLHSALYLKDLMPHELRSVVTDDVFPRMMSMHMFRAAIVLNCINTELQAYCRFSDANINARLHVVWDALAPTYEGKEFLEGRYTELMSTKKINKPLRGPFYKENY